MDGISSPETFVRGCKRPLQEESQSVSTSGSASTSQSFLGSPTINNNKRAMTQLYQHQKQSTQDQAAPMSQFPVLDYHLQQCQNLQGTLFNNTLQPADSSTWSNWQQLPAGQQLELLNQADQQMADSAQPQLTRANSAPELVKLTQADSAAWQQAHAASLGGSNPPTALLSHRDYWVI